MMGVGTLASPLVSHISADLTWNHLELMQAIDAVRKQLHMSQEQLAKRMGKKREAVSRLLSDDDINPTLNTLIELLSALNLTADITLRQAREGEGPIKVATEIAPPQ